MARTRAVDFKNGVGAPNTTLSKSAAIKMDAFASQSHIGMIYAKNADGTDQIIEAKGEAYGTNIWTRTYRGDSSYSGVRRTRLERLSASPGGAPSGWALVALLTVPSGRFSSPCEGDACARTR